MAQEQPSPPSAGNLIGQPLVTIAIPTYNRLTMLRRAVASAQAQEYPLLEIVISDNASQDGTEAFCRELVAQDARVRYHRLTENIGHAGNFRAAFEHVHSPLFMWLADDDWLDPDYVSRCTEELLARPDCVLACGRTLYYEGEVPVELGEPQVNLVSSSPHQRVLQHYRCVVRNGTMLGVMRADCVRADPFPPVFGGDWLLVARLACQGSVRTLESVHLHRTLGGESGDMVALATSFGIQARWARVPNVVIGRAAVADLFTAEAYRRLALPQRFALGLRLVGVFCRRFYVPYFRRAAPGWLRAVKPGHRRAS